MNFEGRPYSVVFRSPSPKDVFCYSPSVIRHKGRIVVTMDAGGDGAADLEGAVREGELWRGRIFVSEDDGKSFRFTEAFPFIHARLFESAGDLYLIGHSGDLKITRSTDGGLSWEPSVTLSSGGGFHASPNNVLHYGGCVYLALERQDPCVNMSVNTFSPVLLRAREGDDLLRQESWTFSDMLSFRSAVDTDGLEYFGVPFYNAFKDRSVKVGKVNCNPPGWLETNVVKIYDPNHMWYGENTFHLFMRAHTGSSGYACMMKAEEKEDGIKISCENVPSGKKVVFIPLPGGQMKFHVIYDAVTRLYFLLSSQATDSMTHIECLEPGRFNLPNNERHRLQIHFSKNMVDWCFACMVDVGGSYTQSRHYASMDFDLDDLIIASRSGDAESVCAHDCNLITFHRIRNFRRLVY